MIKITNNLILQNKIYTLKDVSEWYDLFEKDKFGMVYDIEQFSIDISNYKSKKTKYKETVTFCFDIHNTIFGGKRLCLKEVGCSFYIINWCFGKNIIELKRCLDWLKTLDEWTLINLIPTSNTKPLQYDEQFCVYLKKLGFEVNPDSIKNLLPL